MSAFTKILFGKLRIIEIGPRGALKEVIHFSVVASLPKKYASKSKQSKEKEDDLSDLSPKKKFRKF